MKNLTKGGLLAALAVGAFLVPSCKKDAKTNSSLNQPVQQTQITRPQKDLSMNANLIAYWPMDGSGSDVSGNGHNATITGSVTGTADQFGNANHAMHFDNHSGTNSFMTVLDAADLRLSGTDFTINAWVNLSAYSTTSGSQIMSKRDPGPYGYGCSITGTAYGSGAGLSYIGLGAHGSGNP